MDHPAFEARWGGTGGHMDPLEYSVRVRLNCCFTFANHRCFYYYIW